MIKSQVDFLLALVRRAVLAQALAHAAFHEPYGMLDELRRGAEDGWSELLGLEAGGGSEVGCAVEIGVDPWVGRVGFDAFFVDPEGVVLGELQELPWGVCCWRPSIPFISTARQKKAVKKRITHRRYACPRPSRQGTALS